MGWALFEQSGLMMYPLTLCSVLALGIAIERGFALRHRAIIRSEIVSVIDNIPGPEDIGLALLHIANCKVLLKRRSCCAATVQNKKIS